MAQPVTAAVKARSVDAAEAQSSAAPHDSEQQPASPLPQHQASSQPEAVLTAKTSQHNADALLAASVQVPFASSLEQSDRGLRSIPATFVSNIATHESMSTFAAVQTLHSNIGTSIMARCCLHCDRLG